MIIQTINTSGCCPQTIVIGRRGTYDTMQIAFDLSYLVESFGNGVAVLAVKRSQDESAYPAVVTQEDNTLTWTVSETDTAYVGAGEAQLMWYVDGGLAKTIIYPMVVMRDILATSEEAPEAYQEWVDALLAEGAETLRNAQDAAQSASDAETAKDDAVAAKEAAEEAQEAAETAVTHYPKIENNYWMVWDSTSQSYVSTGIQAEGEDGYSPEVTITSIEGGHRVTITDKDHPQGQSFDVMDGQGGGGTSDYTDLTNKPSINNVTLTENKTAADLGLATPSDIPTDAGDIEFDDQETYAAGSVGAELSAQSNAIDQLDAVETNLFDKTSSGIETGKFINSNGDIANSGIGSVSDYIPVVPNHKISLSPTITYSWYCNLYSSAKTRLSTIPLTDVSIITIPDNVYYIRITFVTAKINDVRVRYMDLSEETVANGERLSVIDDTVNNSLIPHYATASSIDTWTQGSINASTGANVDGTKRIKSGSMYAFDGFVVPKDDYAVMIAVWDVNNTFLGIWDGKEIKKSASYWDKPVPIYGLDSTNWIRIVIKRIDEAVITPAYGSNLYIVNYYSDPLRRLPIKHKNQTINGYSHCAFPCMCYFAGKKIIGYRTSNSHLTPTDSTKWGAIQIDSIQDHVLHHELSLTRSNFTGLDGELRDHKIACTPDGNYLILTGWTTYYVNNARRFDNVIACFDRSLSLLNYQVLKHPDNSQPFKFWGKPLITPTGHLIVAGYNYTSDTSSADNSIKLWRSEEVFQGDVSSLTMYLSATITEHNDSGEATIGYFEDKLVSVYRRNDHNSFIAFSDDLEGTTNWSTSYDLGAVVHAPMLLPHSDKRLYIAGALKIDNDNRVSAIGYYDADTNQLKEIRPIDDLKFNFGGYCDFVKDGEEQFDFIYYLEDSSTSLTTGTTALYLKQINAREVLASIN